jgi:hypothetical protein
MKVFAMLWLKEDGVSGMGWRQLKVLPISASQVVGITDISHQRPALI